MAILSENSIYSYKPSWATPNWWGGSWDTWDDLHKYRIREYTPYYPIIKDLPAVTYKYSTTTYGLTEPTVNSDGVYERDLPGAEDVSITVTNTRLKITAMVKGKEFSAETYIPEAYQGTTPVASYKLGVLRVEFTKVEPTEVEVELG